MKSKTKTQLTDIHLENSLRIASSQIQANIEKLVENNVSYHIKNKIKFCN
jgi:hypothetical protein